MTHFLCKFTYSPTQQHYNYIRATQYPEVFGFYATGLYVLQWSLRTSRTVLVRLQARKRDVIAAVYSVEQFQDCFESTTSSFVLLSTNKPLIIELSVAEDHQYDWGTGTCDMGTVVERWFVQPMEEQTNCFFSNSVGSVYSDHHHHHHQPDSS